MSDITLHRYRPDNAREWNDFVAGARNATFLFNRAYMDYHADRFFDASLIARKGTRIVALLPANIREEILPGGNDSRTIRRILQTHGGLTYGGWILPVRHFDGGDILGLFRLLRQYCEQENIAGCDYKCIPTIYDLMPSQEDRYALFREGASLTECNLSAAIDLSVNPGFNTQQRRNMKRAMGHQIKIDELQDPAPFHSLLSACLAERHGVSPVHTLEELSLLHNNFPENIRIFILEDEDGIQCGVCVYDTGIVAHAQYICSTRRGREEGLLTRLFDELFGIFNHCRYFDFGISNEDHGRWLNEGLCRQKYSLGGRGVVYERYYIDYSEHGD